jgi:sulfoxide reductase heme-binding subunit YedZ
VHLTSNPVDWYAARAAGVTAYLILSGVVSLGLTMAAKEPFARWPRFTLEDVHRFGGLLVGSLIGIHVAAVAIDSWLPFTIQSLIVPFTSRYRPLWVGLGVAAVEVLLALAVTNHYRRRLRYSFWRRAHYLNFAVWGAATAHGIGSGTDRSSPWFLAVFAGAAAVVGALIVWRAGRSRLRSWTIPTAGVAAALIVALILGLGTGPLRFRPRPWNAPAFSEGLTGQVTQVAGITRGIVSMVGQGTGRQNVLVRADLLITTRKLLKTSFQMEYLPSGDLCMGRVTAVHATAFTATCHLRSGERRRVRAQWPLGESAEFTNGTISASSL